MADMTPLPGPNDWRPAESMPDFGDPTLFPQLPEHLIATLAQHATSRHFEAGQMLFAHGDREAPFFVLREGRAVFFDRNQHDNRNTYFSQVTAGMFIGDTSMFTGEPTVAECRAIEPIDALELSHRQLREFVRTNSEASDLILRTLMARRAWLEGHGYGLLQVLGPPDCPGTIRLREFLDRNQIPSTWRDTTTDAEAIAVAGDFGVCAEDFPVLTGPHGVHRNPALRDVARCIGLLPDLPEDTVDVVIVGAGPGGLATAVYAASEGLQTVLLDANAPGGQAGTSSKIENYLGFTTGISGHELARQAVMQARKFGALICNPVSVQAIECRGQLKRVALDDGRVLSARSVVLALGARYRRLNAVGCDRFEGTQLFYSAGHLEAIHCTKQPVVVVGGGNSAGQAAVFLSQRASHVFLAVRRASLTGTMSSYLIERLQQLPNVTILPKTTIDGLQGKTTLEHVQLQTDGHQRVLPCAAVFSMIGAEPDTKWLESCCGVDQRGFVVTGSAAIEHHSFATHWDQNPRMPHHLETTRPGVFAVGDVRSGSVKRVATAVGEGAMAVSFLHSVLL